VHAGALGDNAHVRNITSVASLGELGRRRYRETYRADDGGGGGGGDCGEREERAR